MLASIWLHLVELWQTIADASVLLWGALVSFACSALSTFTASFKSGSALNWLRRLINMLGFNFGRARSADDEEHQNALDTRDREIRRLKELRLSMATELSNAKSQAENTIKEANERVEQSRQHFAKQFDDEVKKINEKIAEEHGKLQNQVRTLKAANTRLKADKNSLEGLVKSKIKEEVEKAKEEVGKAESVVKKVKEKISG